MSAAVTAVPEQRVVLHDVSWETYERLLAERGESASPRFTYDRGVLEIMSPNKRHESLDSLVSALVLALAEAWQVDVVDLGHLTFRHPARDRGFEPDGCFFVGDVAARVRGLPELDPQRDPPPDIVVEVDIARSSIAKLELYAQFGVPEVWRHDGEHVSILVLRAGEYHLVDRSRAFPGLDADRLTTLLDQGASIPLPQWLTMVRSWARAVAGREQP